MISVRLGVFETNSSSTHSIVFGERSLMDAFLEDKIKINTITGNLVGEDQYAEEIAIIKDVIDVLKRHGFNYTYRNAIEEMAGVTISSFTLSDIHDDSLAILAFRNSGQYGIPDIEKYIVSETDFKDYVDFSDILGDSSNIDTYDLMKFLGDLVLTNEDLSKEYTEIFISRCMITFSEMNETCELDYDRDSLAIGENEFIDTISLYGSDSYSFGRWPK